MSTPEEIRQARFEAYDETFEEMETRLKNLEKMVKKNLCSPDSEDSFCDQAGGKRKKPKSFRLLLDKMISFFNKNINIHFDFYVDVNSKK